MDTLSCTAELKRIMIRLKDNRHEITKSAVQSALMITINEEDRTLGLRIIKITVSNPGTETRTTKHPIGRLALTQIGTEIRTKIDSTFKTDQIILGQIDPRTASKNQYNFNARPENCDTQYNKNFPPNSSLPTPNSVEFIDDHDTNMMSDLTFCNQVKQETSHLFRFEISCDPLCYQCYLQDIEKNLRLKTERIEPPVVTYTEDIKPLIETRCRINCHEYESTDATPIFESTPTLKIKT